MQQNRTLFFVIIGVALVAVIGLFLARSFIPEVSPLQRSIQVLVAPSLEPWVTEAAQRFNAENANQSIDIVITSSLLPTETFQSNNPQDQPPAAWLAEATFIIEMGREAGLAFNDSQSVASTSLVWGAYNDKLEQFNQDYGALTWDNINAKGSNEADVLKLVLAPPYNSGEGLAALLSASAAQAGSTTLSANAISAANQWLTETFGNNNTQLPPTPAQTFASVQGRTIGDAGLLTIASWQAVKLDQRDDFTLTPAEPEVVLDFPFAIWTDSQADPEDQELARKFRDFLLAEAQQQSLNTFFFDPALSSSRGVQADGAASQRLLDWANRTLR